MNVIEVVFSSMVGIPPGAWPAARCPIAAARPLFLSKIAAGFPSPAADYIEKNLDLNVFLVQHQAASFYFRVVGESMSGIGIMDGDIVLVDRSVAPDHGHVVLAVIDGDYTIKRLHRQHGRIELHPENPAFAPICLIEGQELQVWGVIAGVVRKIRV